MRDLARYECLERHAAHQTLMAPFPEHAPSALSASGTLLIVPHDADAPPAPALTYLPPLCIVFTDSFTVYYEMCYIIDLLHVVMMTIGTECSQLGGGAGEGRERGRERGGSERAVTMER